MSVLLSLMLTLNSYHQSSRILLLQYTHPAGLLIPSLLSQSAPLHTYPWKRLLRKTLWAMPSTDHNIVQRILKEEKGD